MQFVNPWILLSIPLAVLAAIALAVGMERRKSAMLKVICADNASVSLSRPRRIARYILLICGMVMLIFAASRPYIRTIETTAVDNSRDILILFDVSKSMRASDLPPSRMEQAKYLLREIFKAFPGDRFGIIPFAGRAYLSCPLTGDHHALLTAVEDLDSSSVPVGGTNLALALSTAERAFAGSEGDHRAILLLTDGDQLSGDALKSAAGLKKADIPIAAVGFGSPDAAAPVPGDRGGVMHSLSGEVAGTRLDEALLRKLAAETGGIYLRSTVNDTGFMAVKNFLDKLNKASHDQISGINPDDLFPYFIVAALVLLFASGALSEFRALSVILVLSAVLPLGAEEEALPPPEPGELFRQALELQRSGDPKAEKLYGEVISGKDASSLLRGRALHNLAVMDHLQAREKMVAARSALQKQNTDEALKELDISLKELAVSKELYSRAMEFREKEKRDLDRTGNYQQLILDRQQAEKLKKEIEELKKQQQLSQQKTQQAQQENRQKQQQNQQPQNQQNQQNQQNSGQAAGDAAQAADKLAEQAEKLGQKDLAQRAKDAAEKLKEAEKLQKEGKDQEAQKPLDEAAEKLGSPEEKSDKKSGKKSGNSAEENSGKNEDKTPESVPPAAEGERKEDDGKSDAERKLELLDDEAKALRDAIRRQRNMRRAPVEKDW